MLHQFTFKNFKSFKEEVTLDLTATAIKEHKEDIFTDIFDEKVLTVAAIYGANASGKSNVLEAFQYMRMVVLHSFGKNELLSEHAFNNVSHWFDREQPTEFEVIFSHRGSIYQYGFCILQSKVIEEYLYKRDESVKKEKFELQFERFPEKISFISESLSELSSPFTELFDEQTLVLSILSSLKIELARDVFDWFRQSSVIDYGNPFFEFYQNRTFGQASKINRGHWLLKAVEDSESKRKLEQFIKAIDVGIERFEIVETELSNDIEDEETQNKRVVTVHNDPQTGDEIRTTISNESSGTQKMLLLYNYLDEALENGYTLFIDELDAKLHHLIVRFILIMFHDPTRNKKGAQLIFTTHDVYSLDSENFRRDEIWFVDKADNSVSDLYSLYEYKDEYKRKIRKDASYAKDYIAGRYDSIPRIYRDWEELDGEK